MRLTTITYDAKASWDGRPYRTEALYRTDQHTAMRVKPGTDVQVIAEHGDTTWSDAVLVRWESVPNCDMGLIRFIVTLNGAEHMVDESRIRVP